VTTERENGTLKILFNQGGDWKSIIIGKSLGLFTLAAIVYVPVMAITGVLLFMTDNGAVTTDVFLRFVAVALSYLLYMKLLCIVAVMVSAASKTSRDALIRLIGVWLFFVILFPKTMQAFGNYCYPSPSKVEFEAAIEEEILEKGDYHNPDDEHFTALRDSLLRTYRVDSVQQLPFNYSGFIMREGERISTEIYNRHTVRLMDRYQKQNRFARWPALVNPYTAIRNLSMALTGSDFYAYRNFQKQAEDYRYRLAQHMNTLQMELISNKKLGENDKPYSISREHWHEFPDFHYQHVPFGAALAAEMISLGALLVWCAGLLFYVQYYSKKATVIG
jgi:ABC-2 type transport system permease protein